VNEPEKVIGAAVAGLGVIGAFTFAAQRVAYERFYDQFGITPEDVGIDAKLVLTQTAAGLVMPILLAALFWVPMLIILVMATSLSFRRALLVVVGAVVVFSASLQFFLNAAHADDAARCAALPNGQSVRSLRFNVPFGPPISRLGVRAERAIVRSADRSSPLPAWSDHTVIYLGTSDGVSVVFDPEARRTLLLPANSVDISVDAGRPRYRPKKGCILLT
jgi:hypothetical protein